MYKDKCPFCFGKLVLHHVASSNKCAIGCPKCYIHWKKHREDEEIKLVNNAKYTVSVVDGDCVGINIIIPYKDTYLFVGTSTLYSMVDYTEIFILKDYWNKFCESKIYHKIDFDDPIEWARKLSERMIKLNCIQ